MNLQKLSIGQMAKLNNVSEQTLRLYEKKKLLIPNETDKENGYRYYHILQSARLDLIQNMKTYGMTLKQISEFFQQENPNHIVGLLKEQIKQIDIKLERLNYSKITSQKILENYEKYENLNKNSQIFFEFLGARNIYSYKCNDNFFEQDDIGYEYMLRQLKRSMILTDLPLSYFNNIGTIMRQKHLDCENLFSNEVFVFVDEMQSGDNIETIPSGMYICVCSDEFQNEEYNAKRLISEIKRLNYRVCGDYICEVIVDFPMLELDKRKMFYKIQIPVTPV